MGRALGTGKKQTNTQLPGSKVRVTSTDWLGDRAGTPATSLAHSGGSSPDSITALHGGRDCSSARARLDDSVGTRLRHLPGSYRSTAAVRLPGSTAQARSSRARPRRPRCLATHR